MWQLAVELGSMSQTERIFWIDSEIRAGRCPDAEAVTRRFEVSRRTAFKDRDYLLCRLHAPLVYDRQRRGWTYADPTYALPFLALSDAEAAALRRSLLAAEEYLSPADAEPVRLLAERLAGYLPESAAAAHERVRGSIHLFDHISGDLLGACLRAVEHRHRLRLAYYNVRRDEVIERVVRPYDLLHWRGEPHLIAYCELRQDVRQFFLGRVRQFQMLEPDSAFLRDPAFDIETYLARGLDLAHGEEMVTVRARFTPYQARWIRERRYHPSQEVEELQDGGLLLTLRVAGTEEARRWLLGYGGEVEVLEPGSLRREMAGQAKKLARIYSSARE
jgi:predicted DNA-binding transcriptional regulator YafY